MTQQPSCLIMPRENGLENGKNRDFLIVKAQYIPMRTLIVPISSSSFITAHLCRFTLGVDELVSELSGV